MGLTPLVCIARDYITGKNLENIRLWKTVFELSDNETQHLPGYLSLVPRMPVLLTENVATEFGHSNGTRGIFYQLVYEESSMDVHLHDTNFPANIKFITHPKYAFCEILRLQV